MTTAIQSGTVPASTVLEVAGLQPFSHRSHEANSSDIGWSDGAGSSRESSTVTSESLRVRLTIDPAKKSRGVSFGEICNFALLAAAVVATVSTFGFVLIDLCSAIAQFSYSEFVYSLSRMY